MAGPLSVAGWNLLYATDFQDLRFIAGGAPVLIRSVTRASLLAMGVRRPLYPLRHGPAYGMVAASDERPPPPPEPDNGRLVEEQAPQTEAISGTVTPPAPPPMARRRARARKLPAKRRGRK